MTYTTAGEGVRYVGGRLDMTHAPSLGRYIAKSLASLVSGNRQPVMSGDNRDRLSEHIRHRFDATCETVASEIIEALAAQPSAGAQGEASCDDQFAQASAIAANIGYVLVPEPDHPDCPHKDSGMAKTLRDQAADRSRYLNPSRATPAQPDTGHVAALREALEECQKVFADYAEMHRHKLTQILTTAQRQDVHRKINRNRDMSDMCLAALSKPNAPGTNK